MKVKLIGFQKLDFESSDKKIIKGTKIFVSVPDKNVVGAKPYDFFISSSNEQIITIKLDNFVDKEIDLEVDLKGKALCVSAI